MVTFVIPVHNRKQFTFECLTAVQRQTCTNWNVIVVDDGSTDGTAEMIQNQFPDVHVIKGDGTLYWTAAVNLGIKKAIADGATHIVTMNNDGYPDETFLERMILSSQRKPHALMCAYEIDATTGKAVYGGETTNWFWATSNLLLKKLQETDRHGLHRVSVAPGRGFFIPVAVFERVGLFAENIFPHYMADYDFSCQAIRHGFEIYCNYEAKYYSYSLESGDKEIIRNKSLKNYFNHLFSIKGGGNLRNYTYFTLRNSPTFLVPFHLVKGYLQRILGYYFK